MKDSYLDHVAVHVRVRASREDRFGNDLVLYMRSTCVPDAAGVKVATGVDEDAKVTFQEQVFEFDPILDVVPLVRMMHDENTMRKDRSDHECV